MPLLSLWVIALALASPQAPTDQNPINVIGNRRVYGHPFISPMGEPFRQKAPHDKPLADWFQQADTNHDGYLTVEEIVEDSDRFFAVLDTSHDGRIDPEEIDYYEQVIAPELGGEPYALRGDPMPGIAENDVPEHSEKYATRITTGGGHDYDEDGTGRYGLIDNPEPVTSADTDFNGSVSLQEFRAAAKRRFNLLDQSHTRRISLSQLER
jgi:EF hand